MVIIMQIYLLLTENCNLNCSMCIRGRQQGINIDFETIKKLAQEGTFKRHDLVVTGGEPTLHPQFAEIVRYLCDHAKTVMVTSNGTLHDYLEPLFLRDNLYFQISLDGAQSAHDKIRGEGAYVRTFAALELLDRLGARYSVATVASRKNKDSLPELEKALHRLPSLRYWRVSYEMPFGDADMSAMMTSGEWNDFVEDLLGRVSIRMKIKKIFPFELYDAHREELLRHKNISDRCFNCGSGVNKLYIYPDFTVYSCTCLTDFPIGNLKETPLETLLEGESIQKFSKYHCIEESACADCKYQTFCNGGCIGMSWHYFGKLGMGDMRCPRVAAYGKKNLLL